MDDAQINPREENARQKVRGITCEPFFIGCVQFGGLTSIHMPMIRQKLTMQQCYFYAHDIDHYVRSCMMGINNLTKILK